MATTDVRLTDDEKAILASMVDKKLELLIHDEYVVNPSAYMSVWLVVDDAVFEVHREAEALDHFGSMDDVAVTSVRPADKDDVRSRIAGRRLVSDKVERTILDVKVVEDCQQMSKSEKVAGTYLFTSAIIFELEGTELVLEPDTWFSEDIFILRGPGVSKKLPNAIEDISEGDRAHTEATRKITSMRSWLKTPSQS